ncbi:MULTISPECIES: Asp-tRNA(Asn)/Glu-tRNA(Gln) amidotransferase subunit GatC [Alcaligenes]|jgi:aspartyl-tRNA(Asn)/glutamyl-tRNA(Gln) amidotransferase subunit C|uniref:Aspartyl/glutamyl-tRNA(Asn/Gln) amidotransferase subunit C n=1 Tax=Alcaligenes aquatilis TaxID=323284 RepID=A0A3G2HY45_9BURK|nr:MULTISPECIES: Asp-tRNA(Asn)/Glu-tRNA(Gln) amidotransferase subunit GatC [Alcaligenes]AWG36524.1 Asp-tRNA(Asn)/Glu-tRNA(Gln) amidotransferase GatCAB subunit C [Alcaligenes aquatilis]AYN22086.1 Asp-tRNA(Asn)/Glu-tRNA(Gln) amidotransferase subunit GatC [Alcaligenes aquatilis]MCC9164433.1 Asp-tRNA(Asn)/Glu-tRNA(Gln) amidotransferase subunit GatC [Alcaligenes sp. MMA]MCH4223702.1 Asp-tRNA(Asn)/Glu-tRNA(Gln) amidotransferase subunit GatC [Alcaligenes faecalis]QXR35470.1 Asp-tRNA(Asn)/Glu-tRNA(Gln
MSITEQDVARIAQLARLDLSAEQASQVEHDLTRILGLIQTLQTVDTQGVEPMAHPLSARQQISLRLREDKALPCGTVESRQAMMRNAPAEQDGLFLVPTVIE